MLDTFALDSSLSFVDFTTCDGHTIKWLIRAGLHWLEQNYEAVNRLNVFPVPDGDTGTNMLLTIRAAYHAVASDDTAHADAVAERLAHGALHGSRGNSGTVLSQFFQGFADAMRSIAAFDAGQLAYAFSEAVRRGYQTFQKPVEGTILTVAREMAEEVEVAASTIHDLRLLLRRAVMRGRKALAQTPDQLPILRKAGVVDSGGQGLILILEGMLRYMCGDTGAASETIEEPEHALGVLTNAAPIDAAALDEAFALSDEQSDEGFGYDVQYVIRGTDLDVDAIRAAIAAMGHSPIVVGSPDVVKVHVHVHSPDVPIRFGRSVGRISDLVIENMQAQAEQYRVKREGEAHLDDDESETAPLKIAVVAVAPSDGLATLFLDQGTTAVVRGGQTMNPSVGEFLEAMDRIAAEQIILLPNNPNVILTARQAAGLANDEGRDVRVIDTRTIPQGLATMLAYASDGDADAVVDNMRKTMTHVRSGAIAAATRSLDIDNLQVQTGQYIGLIDDRLVVAHHDLPEAVRLLVASSLEEHHQLVALYSGSSVDHGDAEAVRRMLSGEFPHVEFALVSGGQPHYHYLLGIE